MTVSAAETRIADTGEVARWLADAASAWTADVGGDVSHSRRLVRCYSNSAAVDRCQEIKTTVNVTPSLWAVDPRDIAADGLGHLHKVDCGRFP